MLNVFAAAANTATTDAGKAIALALGIGLGSLGAGVGIGNIFGSMIQAVARQPELRGELQGIQWLGFALTEAGGVFRPVRRAAPLPAVLFSPPPPPAPAKAGPG